MVKNDDVLKKGKDIMAQLLEPHRANQESSTDFHLPAIGSLEDVYSIGSLCNARVIKDDRNPLMPYILNLFPYQKATLLEAASV